jgi:hypothetical protein
MKLLYKVTYKGSWLGGSAIVFAKDETEALRLVGAVSCNFTDVKIELIKKEGVVYNDDGDY